MRKIISRILNTLGIILLVGVIAICIPITVPSFLGYNLYTVVSGSMEPTIPVGSLIYVKTIEPAELVADDVIAFYGTEEQSGIITHRVVENKTVTGELITKGDANDQNDINPVSYNRVIGIVVKSFPILGNVAELVSGLYGKIIAVVLIVVGFVLNLIASKLKEKVPSV